MTKNHNITSANGSAYGLNATNSAAITYTANTNNTSKDVTVKASGSGMASGFAAGTGGSNTVTGIEKIDVESMTGSAYGLNAYNDAAKNDVTMNGSMLVKSGSGFTISTGVRAWNESKNIVTGLTDLTVENAGSMALAKALGIQAGGINSNNDVTMNGAIKVTETGTGIAAGITSASSATNIVKGVKGITVNANTANAYGIESEYGNASNTINTASDTDMGDLSVTSGSGNAYGIYSINTATNTVYGLKSITVKSTSGAARGLRAETGGTNTVTANGGMDVESDTGNTFGMQALGNSLNNVTLAGTLTVKTNTSSAVAEGIQATTNGVNTVKGVTDITIYNKKGEVNGIISFTGGRNTINTATDTDMGDLKVTSDAGNAFGINAFSVGTNEVYGIKGIDASGTTEAVGVRATTGTDDSTRSTNKVVMDGDLTATASGAAGIALGVSAEQGYSDNTITGVKNIEVKATDANSGNALGMQASNNSTNQVNAGNTTDMGSLTVYSKNGAQAVGIQAINKSSNTVGGLTDITVTDDGGSDANVTGIYAMGTSGSTENGSTNTVLMDGDLTVKGNGTDVGGTGIKANYSSTNTITGIKNIDVETVNTTKDSGGLTGISAKNYSTNTINTDAAAVMGTLTVKTKTASTTATTASAIGIENLNSSTNTIGGLGNIDVEVSGTGDAFGIYGITSATNTINTTANTEMGTLKVTTASGAAAGIIANAASTNTVAGLGDITVSGSALTYGVYAHDSSTNDVNHEGDTGRGNVTVTSTAGDAYGIVADDPSTNHVYGYNNYSVTGVTGATGFYANAGTSADDMSSNTVTMNGYLKVTATGGSADGIKATTYSKNIVTGLTDLTVSGTTTATGVTADANSSNTITMNGKIDVTGGSGTTTAVSATNSGTDTITGVTSISAASAGAGDVNGIVADNNSTVNIHQADGTGAVAVTAANTGSGDVYAVTATGNSTIGNISNVTATANKRDAYGVTLGDGTNTITAINNIVATTTSGIEAVGIGTTGSTTGTNTITVAGNIEATNTSGSWAEGIYNSNNKNLTVTVDGNVTTSAPAGLADIVYSAAGNATTDVTIKGNMATTGDTATLVYAYDGDTVNLTGGSTTTLSGTSLAQAALVSEQSTINLKNITVHAAGPADNSYAVYGSDDGGTVNLIDTTITGNGTNNGAAMYYLNDSTASGKDLNVTIDSASSLTGTASVKTDSADNGAINVTNAGTWNVTGDSNLNSAGASGITNTGTINMTADANTFSTIKAHTLANNGNIMMDISSNNGGSDSSLQSDVIKVDTASGTGTITVNLIGAAASAYQDTIAQPLVLASATNNASYTVTNDGNNLYENGSWKYGLTAITLTEAQSLQYYGTTAYAGMQAWVLANTADLSHKAKAALSSIASPDIWYLETDALYDQISNYSQARTDYDAWGHYVHSKITRNNAISNDHYSGETDIENQYNGAVVGVDKRVRKGKTSSTWIGVLAGYGKDKIDYSYGNTDLKSTYAGIYGIYKNTSNVYLAGMVKYNHYKSDIDSYGGSNTYANGNASSNAWGISVLGGKRIEQKNGWFIEPQVEFAHVTNSSDTYKLGDMPVDTDHMNSTRGRIGVGVGQSHHMADGYWDWYARASLIHEFQGSATARLYGEAFDVDYGGTWGQYKLGFDYITKHSTDYNVAFVYNKGGDRTSPLGFQASVNIPF